MKIKAVNKLTLLLHIDGLRYDYVSAEKMPYLHSISKEGVLSRIIPPFGFEPDGAYLTGTYPEDYQGGTHFILNEDGKGIPFAKIVPPVFDYLNIYLQFPIRKILQFLIGTFGNSKRIRMSPFVGQIPFSLLKFFDFCDYYSPDHPNFANNIDTIYDLLRKQNIKYFYQGPFGFNPNAENVCKLITNRYSYEYPFMFLFIADLDNVGHIFGPHSYEVKRKAEEVDNCIREIISFLEKKYKEIDIIAFGDHGMVEVKEFVDLRSFIDELPIKLKKDYIYFLDSTFARFWVFNKKAKNVLLSRLSRLECGNLITESDKKKYRIRFDNRKFGDIIFWINEGKMIFPNFWHVRNKKKGMHGYRNEVIGNHGNFIFFTTKKKFIGYLPQLEMVDVFQTVHYSLFGQTMKSDLVKGEPVQEKILTKACGNSE